MVGEFPELQGVMGRNYALNDGEDRRIADAIAAGIDLVSIADKLSSRADSLRVRNAINAPHPSVLGPRTRIEEKLSPAEIEALRREALCIADK